MLLAVAGVEAAVMFVELEPERDEGEPAKPQRRSTCGRWPSSLAAAGIARRRG